MPDQHSEVDLLEATVWIVAAHVSNNAVAATDLPRLIITVHQELTDLGENPLSPAALAILGCSSQDNLPYFNAADHLAA